MVSDERRATITTTNNVNDDLQRELKRIGVTTLGIGLHGAFHCPSHAGIVGQIIRYCNSDPAFRFSDSSGFVWPLQPTSIADRCKDGKAHEVALQSILVEQSDWYQILSSLRSTFFETPEARGVVLGLGRCIPPSLGRKLGDRISYFIDSSKRAKSHGGGGGGADTPEKAVQKEIPSDAIAVVGMSCKVPGAENLEDFWNILLKGESQHVEVPMNRVNFETACRELDPNRRWFGNFVDDVDAFDHKFFKKSPRESSSMDPQQRMILQNAYQAVEQSGYFNCGYKSKHIGCFVGVSNMDYEHNVGTHPANAYSATGTLKSFVAGKVSHYFGWTGPSLTIDTACSASAVAIHQACKAILNDECSAALAGGVNVITNPLWFQNLAGASFLSPTGPCKPFDAKGDGYCRGEASGAVFLKKLSDAVRDNDNIIGTIASTKVYQNQNCTPITVPNSESLSELFHDLTSAAHLQPDQVSVVEAHGTGTAVGDPAEYDSVKRVFGGSNRGDVLSLGSVKGLVGHAECASGIVSLIKVLLMINQGGIPPQASFDTLNPSIDASDSDKIEITKKFKPWDSTFRAAALNNYGASGSNASMIITEAPQQGIISSSHNPERKGTVKQPFWLAGLDALSVRAYASRLLNFLRNGRFSSDHLSLANMSFNLSRQSNRSLNQSAIFEATSMNELKEKLTAVVDEQEKPLLSTRPEPKPVVMCFGGQVSTFIGLDKEVYEGARVFRFHLDQVDSMCLALGLESIFPAIFQRSPITDTVKLQTVLFAMQYSCAKAWMDCGAHVSAVVGHSFGELTSLCVAGALSLSDAVKMISRRARIIRDSWGGDKGGMVAIEADARLVEDLLHCCGEDTGKTRVAGISCINGPRSFTLGGPTESIDNVIHVLETDERFSKIKKKRLNVSNAFHSCLVDPLKEDLVKESHDLIFGKPSIPCYKATESESEDVLTPDYVAAHMRQPVYFNDAVQRICRDFPGCIWLEAGSKSTITTMVQRAVPSGRDDYFQAMDLTSDSSWSQLSDATVRLWKHGLNLSFWPHHRSQAQEYSMTLLPPYQFEKSKHWLELKQTPKVSAEASTSVEGSFSRLWHFTGYKNGDRRCARFDINTASPKFEEYLSGHTVAHAAPLFPSTLQLEISIEAIMSLFSAEEASNICPQPYNLDNHSPICLDKSRTLWMDVEAVDADKSYWKWQILSTSAKAVAASTLHVSGELNLRRLDDPSFRNEFERLERLARHDRCQELLRSDDVDEVMVGRTIYKAFSEVVDYSEMYRGIRKVVGKGHESAGRVVKRYTGETWLDCPLCDSFCQVAGVFVNCMTDHADGDIYISNKVESVIRSPKATYAESLPSEFDVLAMHQRQSDKLYVSDVFVFDPRNGELLGVILGIGYMKVSQAGMAQVLLRLTPGMSPPKPAVTASSSRQRVEAAPDSGYASPTGEERPRSDSSQAGEPKTTSRQSKTSLATQLKDLLNGVCGIESASINDSTELAEVGVDSLMGMELAREIETMFKCQLDSSELMQISDFSSLVKCVGSAVGGVSEGEGETAQDGEHTCPASDTPRGESNGPPRRGSRPATLDIRDASATTSRAPSTCTSHSVSTGQTSPISSDPEVKDSEHAAERAREKQVNELCNKHAQRFAPPPQTDKVSPYDSMNQCVLLTGATGSLGSHLVSHFARQSAIQKVVCVNRPRSGSDPMQRQRSALQDRGISMDETAFAKLVVVEMDTSKPCLGLSAQEYDELSSSVTHIVHNAWPMTIARPVRGFEPQFQTMRNLIDLAADVASKRPTDFRVGFQFISSIATVGLYPHVTGNCLAPEERMGVACCLPSGYGDAKLVCERMLDQTLHKFPHRFRPMIARIGQIAGSKDSGWWNSAEHMSFLIKSSQTLQSLPDLPGVSVVSPLW